MKTSIDLPDELYRRVKSKSALEGRSVREVATALFTAWIEGRAYAGTPGAPTEHASESQWLSEWQSLGADIARITGDQTNLVDQLIADRR